MTPTPPSETLLTPSQAAPHRISAAALEAARAVLQLYDLTVRAEDARALGLPHLRADLRCLAILIDVTTNVFHAAQIRPELRYWQRRMAEGSATASDIQRFLRKLGVELEYLPNYAERDDEHKLVYADATIR